MVNIVIITGRLLSMRLSKKYDVFKSDRMQKLTIDRGGPIFFPH